MMLYTRTDILLLRPTQIEIYMQLLRSLTLRVNHLIMQSTQYIKVLIQMSKIFINIWQSDFKVKYKGRNLITLLVNTPLNFLMKILILHNVHRTGLMESQHDRDLISEVGFALTLRKSLFKAKVALHLI